MSNNYFRQGVTSSDTFEQVFDTIRPGQLITSDLMNKIIEKMISLDKKIESIETIPDPLFDLMGTKGQDAHTVYININGYKDVWSMYIDGNPVSIQGSGLYLALMNSDFKIITQKAYTSCNELNQEFKKYTDGIFVVMGMGIHKDNFSLKEITPEDMNNLEVYIKLINFVAIGHLYLDSTLEDEIDIKIRHILRRHFDIRAVNHHNSDLSVFGAYKKNGDFILGGTNGYSTGSILNMLGQNECEF
jgi:hypothetical protein